MVSWVNTSLLQNINYYYVITPMLNYYICIGKLWFWSFDNYGDFQLIQQLNEDICVEIILIWIFGYFDLKVQWSGKEIRDNQPLMNSA